VSFKVAARTILELGAELISSDAVAIYELVKNAIDARSNDGVTIEFCITLRHSDYIDALTRTDELLARQRETNETAHAKATNSAAEVAEIKKFLVECILPDAPAEQRRTLRNAIETAVTAEELRERLREAYVANNWIEFRDTGRGMSQDDLLLAYLVIGTPSRRRDVDAALATGRRDTPFLGEKGVGRLSAMRLGSRLHVKTATVNDARYNILDVDWSEFEDLSKLIGDIAIEPRVGRAKSDPE
jgi:hypothetical protein